MAIRRVSIWMFYLVVASVFLFPDALADDEVELRWNARPGDCFEYSVSVLAVENGVVRGSSPAGKAVLFFGHELSPEGDVTLEAKTLSDLAYYLVLMVPGTRQKIGFEWQHVRRVESIPGMEPLEVQGKCTLVRKGKVDVTPCVEIRGEFSFHSSGASKGTEIWRVARGRLTFTAHFAESDGVLKRALMFLDADEEPVRKDLNLNPMKVAVNEELNLKRVTSSRTSAFIDRVHETIAKGVEYLKSAQGQDGSWGANYKESYPMGPTALVLLALLKCGVPLDDPVVKKGFEYLRKVPFQKVYSVSLLLMLLEAKYTPYEDYKSTPKELEETEVTRYIRSHISREDLAWAREAAEWLLENSVNESTWSYPGQYRSSSYDHSNTQYAVLGLKAAWRCGVGIKSFVWKKILKHFAGTQEGAGDEVWLDIDERCERGGMKTQGAVKARARGWGYSETSEATGSMTCAGIASVVIARSGLLEARELSRGTREECGQSIRDGLAWMQKNFSVRDNPKFGGWLHYYLYGMERAFILAGVDGIGGHDWYLEGALILVCSQGEKGEWVSEIETSFALLFLRRATMPVRTD